MHYPARDILLFIAGLYLYGIRNLIGKWLVINTLSIGKVFLIKTERHFRIYWHFYLEELKNHDHLQR